MLPFTTRIVLNQGLVESQETLVTSSHMSFFSQPSLLPPHLSFPPYGLQSSLATLSSSSRVNGDFSSNLSQLGSSSSLQESTCNPWPWSEEETLRPSSAKDQDLNKSNKNSTANHRNNYNNHNNNIGVNSLSTVGAKKMKKVMKARRKVREPRFCFKTMSEVDVLDDGYKWRKYGQKVVKNTQHPRSYYRCTQDNCRVKKRVERLAEDARMVITTYEGRHVHSPPHDEEEGNPASSHINFFC